MLDDLPLPVGVSCLDNGNKGKDMNGGMQNMWLVPSLLTSQACALS
jgi:hypothetical protein